MSSVFNFQSNVFNFIQLPLASQSAGKSQSNYDDDDDGHDDEDGDVDSS